MGKVELTEGSRQKLGPRQIVVLRFIEVRDSTIGVRKSGVPSSDWRVIDRLYDLGFLYDVFMPGKGPTYFLTDSGRAALKVSPPCRIG